jgi:competence protein ComEA
VKHVLLIALLLAFTGSVTAADANTANRAQLEQIKHIGPPLADAILVARDKDGSFKHWADLMLRVRGIRESKASKLSDAGLTVGGAPYAAPPK